MIHFKEELRNKADLLHTIKEYADAFKDLSKIEYTVTHIYEFGGIENAKSLHKELFEKYPEILAMLTVAEMLPRVNTPLRNKTVQQIPEVSDLIQDKFGIYTHILLKSKDIKEIKDFIDYVD